MDYGEWCSQLAHHFFNPSNAGLATPFFVDDDALMDIHPSGEIAAASESLAKVVRARCSLRSEVDVFSRIVRDYWDWEDDPGDGPPPSLPLLAVFVNAVTHMQAEGSIPRHNYYKRLRGLLGMHVEGGMPPGYDVAAKILWPGLRQWLNVSLGGSHGVAVISSHPVWTNIGYAYSQTLLRRSDINRLTSLFERLDIEPVSGDEARMEAQISKAELLLQFKAWSHNRAGLSSFARRFAADKSYDELLSDVLWHAALRWVGGRLDESGRQVGRIRLVLSAAYEPEFAFMAERPDGFPVELQVSASSPSTLASSGASWYDLTPLSLDSFDHEDSWSLVSAGAGDVERVLRYQPSPVVPFREDFDAYRWVSVRTVSPQQSHWLLVDKSLGDEVDHYLREFAQPGWERIASAGIPSGYVAYRNVRISHSAPRDRYLELWRLKVQAGESLVLRGGMKLPDPPNSWLAGGEPDVWVPSILAATADGKVWFDGIEVDSVPTLGGNVQLSSLGAEPGNHEVVVGPATRRFTTVDTRLLDVQPATGSLGVRLRRVEGGYLWIDSQPAKVPDAGPTPEAEVWVSGARISEGRQMAKRRSRPITLSVGARGYLLLGAAPGDIHKPVQPHDPEWLARVPELSPSRFEVYPYFDVVWVVHLWTPTHAPVRLRDSIEPLSEPRQGVPKEEVEEWSQWLERLEDPGGDASGLWQRYLATAEEIRPNA